MSQWTIRYAPPAGQPAGVEKWRVIRGGSIARYEAPAEQAMEEWGVTDMTRTRRMGGDDSLSMACDAVSVLADPPFAVGSEIQVFRDGARWFYGHCTGFELDATGGDVAYRILVSGPQWWMRNIVFQGERPFVDYPNRVPTTGVSATTFSAWQDKAKLQVNYLSAYGSHTTRQLSAWPALAAGEYDINSGEWSLLDLQAALTAVLEFAEWRGAPVEMGVFPDIDEEAPPETTLETLAHYNGTGKIMVPAEYARNPTCADAVASLLRWVPNLSCVWGYSRGGIPLDFVRLSERPILDLPLGDVDGEPGDVRVLKLLPRTDILVPGVEIQYHYRSKRDIHREIWSLVHDRAGDHEAAGALVAAIELRGGHYDVVTDPTGGTAGYQPVPVGVAAALYEAYGSPQMEGSVELVGNEPSATDWLANRVQITGGPPWSQDVTCNVVSQVDRIAAGTTTVEFGPPSRLGPAEMIDLLGRTLEYVPPGSALAFQEPPGKDTDT
jgi:hypothetical protein